MRFCLVVFLCLFSRSVFSQENISATLEELRLKPYDSKKQYTARELEHSYDPFTGVVAVIVYKGKKKFTGSIRDISSDTIVGRVRDGVILEFSSKHTHLRTFHHYAVIPSAKYAWYAVDTTFSEGSIWYLDEFYEDSAGMRMHRRTEYVGRNWMNIKSYRIGKANGNNVTYHYPIEEGVWTTYKDGEIRSLETWRDGHYDGLMIVYDSNEVVLQKYYLNSWLGVHGSYYEYDTAMQIVVTGMYSAKHVETGQWVGKYTDSSIARISWFDKYGDCDSTKSWDTQGNLINVSYHHWRNGKRSGDFVRYSKTWYPNGQLAAWENHSPFLNDTMYAQYTENGSPIQIECKYKGHIQKKTWYENGNPQTERYGVSSGIEGVTFRDSVFREWFRDGTLWKERYYDKGKSIRNNDPPNNFLAYDTRFSRGAAYVVAVTAETTTRAAWDTSFTVPLQVVDSVAVSIDNVLRYSSDTYHGAAHAIRTICVSQRANGVPDCTYTLMLTKQEYVTRDSTGRILTADIRLNQFLDSLKLTANTVNMCADRGMRKGKTINDFCITFNPTAQYLNLLYINRRLAVLAPGSVLQLSQENKTGPSSEIFYFPQGEPVGTDTTQVTIFVVEDYLFHIYGDGEVEFARLISKDQLLLEYRGEKTSAHTPKRRR